MDDDKTRGWRGDVRWGSHAQPEVRLVRPSRDAVRLSPTGLAAIDVLAMRRGLTKANGAANRSEMVRRLLAEALALPHNRLP